MAPKTNRQSVMFEVKGGGIHPSGHCDIVAALQDKAYRQTQWLRGDYLSSPVWQNHRLTICVNTDKAPANYESLVKDYIQALLELLAPGATVRLIKRQSPA